MVVLRYEVEHPPGVFHGVGHIAPSQGQSGTVQWRSHPGRRRNSSSSTTTIVSRWGFRSRTPVCRRVQPPFGVPQAVLNALDLAAIQ